jgi:hypothetical protein
MARYEVHPYAEIFPAASQEELLALQVDINANGLLKPIILHEDMVLDGRSRRLICALSGVKPHFEILKGDDAAALAFVISRGIAQNRMTERSIRNDRGADCEGHGCSDPELKRDWVD